MLIVERIGHTGLRRVLWRFTVALGHYDTVVAVLDEYRVENRQTRRHKWTRDHRSPLYDRLYQRRTTIPREEVPLPPDVIEEARAYVVAKVSVSKEYP